MPRLIAVEPQTATGRVKDLLTGVQASLGVTPNLFRTLANSSAALEAYLSFNKALSKGKLSAPLREQLALTVAEENVCRYCLAAHTAIGKSVGLEEEAILASRRAEAENGREGAALRFAKKLIQVRGQASEEDLNALREAGFSDGEIAEIVANVALNVFTNYFNLVAGTEVDFPQVPDVTKGAAYACG